MNQNYYEDKLKTLPEDLQYAVMMSDWEKSLVDIKNKFKLHIDQTQVLENSVIRLMFGDIDAPTFISNMFNEAHINSETSADILLDVDMKILKNIRNRLEDMEKEEENEKAIDEFMMDDQEREDRDNANTYAKYYEEMHQLSKDIDDGKIELEDDNNTEIPEDIEKEKEDILQVIESSSPIRTKTETTQNNTVIETEKESIKPDHQLQNKEIEKPFHEEDVIKENIEVEVKKDSVEQEKKPDIKKPISINLNDIYREPIE